jgi:ABC-2 type transport system permease protein
MLLFYGSYVLFSIISVLIFGIELYHLSWMLTIGASVIATNACIGLSIDAWRPRLDWKLPQQAVKQNLNGVIGMALSALHIAFLAALVYLLVFLAGLSTLAGALLLLVPSIVLFASAWHLAMKSAQRLYAPA